MSESYVKLLKSQETYFLRTKYPNAFLLLSFIACLIRQTDDDSLDLKKGEMIITNYRDSGITSRQQYRTALQKLLEFGHISIIETFKGKNSSTIKATMGGVKIKLLSSTIYDMSNIYINHQSNHLPTIIQPSKQPSKQPSNLSMENEKYQPSKQPSKQPIINKKEYPKKERNINACVRPAFSLSSSEEKTYIQFPDREYVQITQKEYDSLATNPDVGKEMLEEMLDILESYKGSTGKTYFSDYHVLKKGGWVRKKYQEEKTNIKRLPKTIRERVLEKFKNDEISNGYQCFVTEEAIAFTCLNGPTHHQLPFRIAGFEDQLQNIIYKIKWKQNLEIAK